MDRIENVEQLEDLLSEPTDAAVMALAGVDGDLVILGVAGKMGPTLARMAVRAFERAGVRRRVIGVARFSEAGVEERLRACSVETIRCDLLDSSQIDALPDAPNVVFMTGMKFGATGQEGRTWAMNCWLPGLVCRKYRRSRIVVFSTGNVYGLTPVSLGGSVESDALHPVGEYAQSCLGRERIFEHFSRTNDISMSLLRLNYATEMRYGVLVDLAQRVLQGHAVDVTMGHVNALWQADANAMALASFAHVSTPPLILNLAGPELLSVRRIAEEFARRFRRSLVLEGIESSDALLSNAQRALHLFGYPRVSAGQMIAWIADWLERGGDTFGKPTHFEVRHGQF
ncbi:MAG TPA: NAD-dependent epimerase/dehydratase family protein [Gemmataceae bacterium]|nr:NAD-dependent epimerase/dehydratase family protein [Gemmataceae bacterium]